ncbi:hypothetical protein PPYR_13514 [Photinus pyralis]|uniref:Tachykinin n=2 Tax=Photinus pyralis TaxID=7054 RepID=A0A1Y1NGA9_PHOPY|nr:tachykinins isoform X2 [Photinus pyralis]KAB0793894.1 hypothetical protein PPYR_13514 [Photinus pyralis]
MWRIILMASLLSASIEKIQTADQVKRRAPSGFTGVRGKKSIPDSTYSDTTQILNDPAFSSGEDGLDKRAPAGFMGMRGKKPFPESNSLPEDIEKRAPSGFMGMRGKKENLDDYDKRAPSGFMGMRGKKEYDADYYGNDFVDKRARGFMGMRGKKSIDEINEEVKRAVLSGFFGMRGKKQPARSSFFGMRGKKYPYEFRGKFVGVRGKKSSNEIGDYGYLNGHLDNEEQLAKFAEDLDLNQLMLLLTDNNGNQWDSSYLEQDRV